MYRFYERNSLSKSLHSNQCMSIEHAFVFTAKIYGLSWKWRAPATTQFNQFKWHIISWNEISTLHQFSPTFDFNKLEYFHLFASSSTMNRLWLSQESVSIIWLTVNFDILHCPNKFSEYRHKLLSFVYSSFICLCFFVLLTPSWFDLPSTHRAGHSSFWHGNDK